MNHRQYYSEYAKWERAVLRRHSYIARVVMRDAVERYLIGGEMTREAGNAEKFSTVGAARDAVREFTRGMPLWAYAADIFDVDSEEPIGEDQS